MRREEPGNEAKGSCGSFHVHLFCYVTVCIHVQLHPDGSEVERGHVPASAPAVLCLLL